MNLFTYNDELCHYGVKGQRWGVRRYQNSDGTLTQAGKDRYLSDKGHQEALETIRRGYYRRSKGHQWLSDKDYDRINSEERFREIQDRYRDKNNKDLKEFWDSDGRRKLVKKARGLFASAKTTQKYQEAVKKGREIYDKNFREFIGESLETVYQMPKKDRDFYKALIQHYIDPYDF